MLGIGGETKIFVCLEATDFRKGFEGLSSIVESLFPEKLLTGSYFVFLNKSSTGIKILYWDLDGLAIWNKRLESGTYSRKGLVEQIDRCGLLMLLEGVLPQKRTKRFRLK